QGQSIMSSTLGVLVGTFAASFVVRRTVRPLTSIASAIRALAAGRKETSIPGTGVNNEIGDIARAAGAGARRAAAGGRKLPQAVRGLGRRHLCDDAGGRAAQRQSGAGAHHG